MQARKDVESRDFCSIRGGRHGDYRTAMIYRLKANRESNVQHRP